MSHASTTPPVKKATLDYDRSIARFTAKHLIALEPITRASQDRIERFSISGLIVEPDPDGGVFLIATDGSVLAVIRDRTGRVSRRLRLTIDDATFAAARPPSPVRMWSEGETCEIDLPEWAQPDQVMAWGLSCMVFPAMHLPGDDPLHSPILGHSPAEEGNVYRGGYRMHADPVDIPWRRTVSRAHTPGDGRVHLAPTVVALFAGIQDAYDTPLQFDIGTSDGAIVVSAPGHPDFIGAMMPAPVAVTDDPVPAWARA